VADQSDLRLTIGRNLDNDLVLNDDSISLHHAKLRVSAGRNWLHDLQSSNGTYVNGRRISESEIHVGDFVNFGTVTTTFNGAKFEIVDVDAMHQKPAPKANSKFVGLPREGLKKIPLFIIVLALVIYFLNQLLTNDKPTSTEIARATVNVVMKDVDGSICWGGSGAVILDGQFVVTNAHVAAYSEQDGIDYANCEVLSVGISDKTGRNIERFVSGSLVAIDVEKDLAIIKLVEKLSGKEIHPLVIRNGEAELEENVRVFGYPAVGGDSLTISTGIVSGLDQSEQYSYIKLTADISSGNSGGPVVDNNGRLIGIASANSRQEVDCSSGSTCFSEGNSLGLARPVSLLKPLLDKVRGD
jgi:S1-C subfamily serine protease